MGIGAGLTLFAFADLPGDCQDAACIERVAWAEPTAGQRRSFEEALADFADVELPEPTRGGATAVGLDCTPDPTPPADGGARVRIRHAAVPRVSPGWKTWLQLNPTLLSHPEVDGSDRARFQDGLALLGPTELDAQLYWLLERDAAVRHHYRTPRSDRPGRDPQTPWTAELGYIEGVGPFGQISSGPPLTTVDLYTFAPAPVGDADTTHPLPITSVPPVSVAIASLPDGQSLWRHQYVVERDSPHAWWLPGRTRPRVCAHRPEGVVVLAPEAVPTVFRAVLLDRPGLARLVDVLFGSARELVALDVGFDAFPDTRKLRPGDWKDGVRTRPRGFHHEHDPRDFTVVQTWAGVAWMLQRLPLEAGQQSATPPLSNTIRRGRSSKSSAPRRPR